MIRTLSFAAITALLLSGPVGAQSYEEPPALTHLVAGGDLPAIDERLPSSPLVTVLDRPWQNMGEYGGELTTLMGRAKDIRLMTVYGYARLIGYNPDLDLMPDIAERIDVEDGRVFTFHLRPGHKWSDGHPFTSEDFRYYWEDYVNNPDLSFGPNRQLLVDGEPPVVEIIDETTVRYSWSQPNPYFLPALAGASPLFIYMPAHYLKQFHAKYADPVELAAAVERVGVQDWSKLHTRMNHPYRNDNVDMPTLDPWVNTSEPTAERFIFVRNPYYHRIDEAGRQLPYIDKVIINLSDSGLIPAKTGFGETDLQGRYIDFKDYTFLKEGEASRNFTVGLWRSTSGSQVALYPNLNANDPVWRALLRDARFRRALSLAIDRDEINQVIYFGLGTPGNNTILSDSPLFEERFETLWAEYDIDQANALLDELGLEERGSNEIRLLPNGEELSIVVETAGESTEETDVLELIRDSWSKIGVGQFTKASQREIFRNRIYAGETVMSVWSGLTNGVPTADIAPGELAPTEQVQLQWPKWGQYVETSGDAGEPIDDALVVELDALRLEWEHAAERERRAEVWKRMLAIHADEQYSIGTVRGIFRPVVISRDLRNVPSEGIWNWDPGAYFGMYRMDAFWFGPPERRMAR